MSLADFFSPINVSKITPKDGYYASHLGVKISIHEKVFPDLEEEKYDVAIIGVLEDRGLCKRKTI